MSLHSLVGFFYPFDLLSEDIWIENIKFCLKAENRIFFIEFKVWLDLNLSGIVMLILFETENSLRY